MKLLVTGGAGFIGSNFVCHALKRWPEASVGVLDKLTYAGNLANLVDVWDDPRFSFQQGDICDPEAARSAMTGCSHLLNFAAETHVDRSILDPDDFVRTDIHGTRVLLETARDLDVERYLQVSTDEVYGDVPEPARSREEDPVRPRSPYSASKAGGDLMALAYFETFGLPVVITRGANTYGPYQYPEKLIPLFVTNALDGEPLPMYGDGQQVRDWLFVEDHCAGIATVLERGTPGQIYNLGAGNERPNRDVIDRILHLTGADPSLLRSVPDRPGHDRRYALDCSKATNLGWKQSMAFDASLAATVEWYSENRSWWEPIKQGDFREYYQTQYAHRLAESAS
ncbi:MAG: dTDP-glucose 4,6-dehydratase [Chloroflexota bacterium]